METNPHVWISALRNSQNRLTSNVQPLIPNRLGEMSYDSEWTIAQVLSHLGSQAELFMGWLDAAVQGVDPPGREAMQVVWDAWNARSPEEQARESLAYNERLVERFESVSDSELNRMHLSLFGMELDAANFVRMRVGEHVLHTWDIAVVLDNSARLDADAVDLLIDALAQVVGRAGKPQGREFAVAVYTREPHRRFLLEAGDSVKLKESHEESADGELRLPSEAFVRLVYGRLDPDHSDGVEVTGDVTLEELRSVFPGF